MNLPTFEHLSQQLSELESPDWRRQRQATLGIGNLFQELARSSRPELEQRLHESGRHATERLHRLLAQADATRSVRVAAALALEKVLDACRFPATDERIEQVRQTLSAIIEDHREATQLRQAAGEVASRLVEMASRDLSPTSDTTTLLPYDAGGDTAAEPHVLRTLEEAGRELVRLQAPLERVLERALGRCAGYRPQTLPEGQQLARQINQLVAAYGFRLVVPPHGDPVTLAFKNVGRSKPGAFVFRSGSTTLYAGVTLPDLSIRPASG